MPTLSAASQVKNEPGGRTAGRSSSSNRLQRTRVLPLVLPSVVLVALVFLIPILVVAWVSLHRMDYFELGAFAGFEQYVRLAESADFWKHVLTTLTYVFGSMALSIAGGLMTALLLQSAGRLRNVFRPVLLLPWALSQATVAIAWVWMLNPSYGPVSFLLQQLGFAPSLLLGSPDLALPLLIAITAWWAMPYAMVLLDAALQSMPAELYEAATLDGANPRKAFLHLTLPLMRPTIAATASFLAMLFFAMVTLPLVLTGGGPLDKTESLSLNLFTESVISGQNVGGGAAVAIVLLLANVVFGLMMLRYGKDAT